MEKQGKIAVQMMMVKEAVAQNGAFAVLKQLHDLGFHCVEVSQIPMTEENLKEMEQARAELGMEFAACSAVLEAPTPTSEGEFLSRDYDKYLSDCRRLGAKYLRIGAMPMDSMLDKSALLDYAGKVNAMAQKLAEDGISLYFHNHHREFRKFEGDTILDLLCQAAPDLGFELDVHWIQRGGKNPLEVIPQYAGKLDLLHLKDYRIDWPGLSDWKTEVVQFAEVGEGTLPMAEIIQAGLAAGSRYFIIEQDESYQRTAFESLAISRKNLCAMGYENWF